MKKITEKMINNFKSYLLDNEKSKATLEKYVRDIRAFALWLGSAELSKARVLKYKDYIIKNYAPASVNSMLSSLNGFLIMQKNTALK